MSPAGYWPQLKAAVEAGADSVYFGLKHFTARAKVGFDLDEVPEVMAMLRKRGVRGYVTFNTLVFEHELDEAAKTIASLAHAGVDALIIQDLGIVHIAKEVAPNLELHASTQMSVTSAEGVRLAQSMGADRVTLARELSLEEVGAIAAKVDCELEIFVHGALCVAYSGQCFSSEAWGGRSANRGQCAQACRLPYELIVDDRKVDLADSRYLLSPGDLMGLDHVPAMVKIGVSALKIEGRYKEADYVALTTRAYRKAVDEAYAGLASSATEAEKLQLEQVYSRGLAPHFLVGTNHQAVVEGRSPRHRGVEMGRVVRVDSDQVVIKPGSHHEIKPLKAGDGVMFDAADWRSPQEPEEGGRVYQVTLFLDGTLGLRFRNEAIRTSRIRAGDRLWRTDDPDLASIVRPYLEASAPIARQKVEVSVDAAVGTPLSTTWCLAKKPSVQVKVCSESVLASAQNRALTADYLRDQLGRLGGTAYELGTIEARIEGAPFAAPSVLNQIRREAVRLLETAQTQAGDVARSDWRKAPPLKWANRASHPAEIHVLVRTPAQLDAAAELPVSTITLDYLDLYGLRPSVERLQRAGRSVRVASPRILKPGESRIAQFLLSLNCPIVVRSGGLLETLRAQRCADLIGDFGLNAANSVTSNVLLELGLTKITPTHDLNAAQIATLAEEIGPEKLEVVAFQHLPVFHTEHCVFCRFLSTGTSYRDCGRPCESHVVSLQDQSGRHHPVIADVGCRNTVFGAEAQEASTQLKQWREAGIIHFRLEFVHETPEQVRRVTMLFHDALSGRISFDRLKRELREATPEGTTEGSLFVPNDHLRLTVLQ